MQNGLFKRGLLKNGKNKNFFEFDGEKMVRYFWQKNVLLMRIILLMLNTIFDTIFIKIMRKASDENIVFS